MAPVRECPVPVPTNQVRARTSFQRKNGAEAAAMTEIGDVVSRDNPLRAGL